MSEPCRLRRGEGYGACADDVVLAGNHHSGDSLGPALSVFHGYLGLAVRTEALDGPQLAGVGECQRQPVGKHHGQGEELERFRTGESCILVQKKSPPSAESKNSRAGYSKKEYPARLLLLGP